MAIKYHPEPGAILVCDFAGFKEPEMVKRRPVIVVSPRFRRRDNLCTIVPLSTTRPRTICDFHYQLTFDEPLPPPYSESKVWVKADMVCAVSFDRLSLPFSGKDASGKRIYDERFIDEADLKQIRTCILHSLGLGILTSHL
jgi:uncharacterized protein YifN (PemK superfamily)